MKREQSNVPGSPKKAIPLDKRASFKMSRVKTSGTPGEVRVRKALRRLSVGYRLNVRALPGSPDVANASKRWAIFVHGCFWHRHTACKKSTIPHNNSAFWEAKFNANRERDERKIKELQRAKFDVLTIWECETLDQPSLEQRLQQFLQSSLGRNG